MPLPDHLRINGRDEDQNFSPEDKLFHGYEITDFDVAQNSIRTETIRFPDFSCNWSKYSEPEDVKYRLNGKLTDGCYSFTVEVARYDNLATPVHDPIDNDEFSNYSHVEIRALREGEDPNTITPPRNRKLVKNKERKLAYRQNIVNRLNIEIAAS